MKRLLFMVTMATILATGLSFAAARWWTNRARPRPISRALSLTPDQARNSPSPKRNTGRKWMTAAGNIVRPGSTSRPPWPKPTPARPRCVERMCAAQTEMEPPRSRTFCASASFSRRPNETLRPTALRSSLHRLPDGNASTMKVRPANGRARRLPSCSPRRLARTLALPLLFVAASIHAEPREIASSLTLEEVVAAALRDNPRVRSMEARCKAAAESRAGAVVGQSDIHL